MNLFLSSLALNVEASIVSSLPQTTKLLHKATELATASHCGENTLEWAAVESIERDFSIGLSILVSGGSDRKERAYKIC